MTEANKKRAVKATPKILVSDGAKKFLKDLGFEMSWLESNTTYMHP